MSLPTPNNRYEEYLNAIATGDSSGLPTPINREEIYLDFIAKNGGGGGGGTTNYNALSNKPQVNGVELSGNKTASALGLAKEQFTGSQAEWDALTSEQKSKYEIVNIDDDTDEDLSVAVVDLQNAVDDLTTELKGKLIAKQIPYSGFTWDATNKRFTYQNPDLSGINVLGFIVRPTNGLAVLGGYMNSNSTLIYVAGVVPSLMASITEDYAFVCYAIGTKM